MTKNGILKNVNHQLIVGTHYKVSNDVYRIESMAFAKLGIKKVTVPENVKEIGDKAFSHCISLKRLDIPNGIEIIDSLAFNSCHNLVSLVIPKSIKKIANWAFSYCENLDLTIETSLFHFDGNSFIDGNKRIENLTIYNHKINLDGNWNDEIRNVRIKELKDMIDTYLRNNNITDSRFYDFNTHRNFILFIVNNLESSIIKDYDYKDYFDKYMNELFGPKINSIQEIFPINIQQLINNNANENNNMPYHLYLYGKELNLTDKILEIKRRIEILVPVKYPLNKKIN